MHLQLTTVHLQFNVPCPRIFPRSGTFYDPREEGRHANGDLELDGGKVQFESLSTNYLVIVWEKSYVKIDKMNVFYDKIQ